MKLELMSLFLLAVVHSCQSCSCDLPADPLEQFKAKYCASDFVFKARIKGRLVNRGGQQVTDAYYKIKVFTEYKIPDGGSLKDEVKVYTASNSALCGVTLQPGMYILSGEMDGRSPSLNLCGSITSEFPLTDSAYSDFLQSPVC